MSSHKRNRSAKQRKLRQRRGERAFLFDQEISRCLGDADRDDWEFAIAEHGGNVLAAGEECGIPNLPRSAKALWGRSAEEAANTYRRWLKKRSK
jgi:hypothetical protein